MVPSVNRRRALQTSCTAALVALAGCLGGGGGDDDDNGTSEDGNGGDGGTDGGGNGSDDSSGGDNGSSSGNGGADVRPYSEFVATDDAGEAAAVYADFVALRQATGEFENLTTDSEDPLLLLPAQGVSLLRVGSLRLEAPGLGQLLDRGETRFDSEVEALALAGQAFVAMGSIQIGEIAATLSSDAGEIGPFERTSTVGSFSLFQPTSDEATTVAVSDGAVIVSDSPQPVERAVQAAESERPRAGDAVDEFGWVLDAVDDPDVAFAGHGSPPAGGDNGPSTALSGSNSFIAAHSFGAESVTADAAAVYPSADALDEASEDIEASLGREADDTSFEFDADRMSATATYQVNGADDQG